MLGKKVILLSRIGEIASAETQETGREYDQVMFVSERLEDIDEPMGCVVEVAIDAGTWIEMNKPDEITVTIDPGDSLND